MAEQDQSNTQAEQNQAGQPKFMLQRIYMKDSSFESPSAPLVFAKEWKPKMSVDLNTQSKKIADNNYEVELSVTVTAKIDDDQTAFLVEVVQGGLFYVQGIEGEGLSQALGIACPNMLFPYLREAVDSMVVKGGFPALALQPVNFETLYRQAKKEHAEKQAAASTTH